MHLRKRGPNVRTILTAAIAVLLLMGRAFAATPGGVGGTVTDSDGRPIAGASVSLQGPGNPRAVTDARGSFSLGGVSPGEYTLVISKSGFAQYTQLLSVFAGETAQVHAALIASTFASLRTIAHVSTTHAGYAAINTTTAAVNTINGQVFANQGQLQVTKVLNETPGVIAQGAPGNNNGASQGSPQTVQIRGTLPYETESLIDGHPTPISLTGTFNPIYLNPALLEDVEVVKGPGYMGPEINYAIGGTANYITLQPTRTPQALLTVGTDNWGGVNTAFRATGSTRSHVLDYAFGYATNGSPGPLQNYPVAGSQINMVAGEPFSWRINGQYLAMVPELLGPAPASRYYKYIGLVGQVQFADPLYVCCWKLNTSYDSKAELGKVRLNFSQASSLTLSYLGGQAFSDAGGIDATSVAPIGSTGSFAVFAPPPGYHGSIHPGTAIPFEFNAFLPEYVSDQQNLYQGEFRTTFGRWTALARYFSGADSNYAYLDAPANAPYVFGGSAWGGVPLCPSGTFAKETPSYTIECTKNGSTFVPPVMTFFNGQHASLSMFNAINQELESDHLRGESLLLQTTSNNGGDFTLSADRSHHDSYQFINDPVTGLPAQYLLPRGASQSFTTETVRDRFYAAKNVFASLADYAIQYRSHYTDDGGKTWQDATRGYNAPRAAVTWQPNSDVSWRFAAGASIAPPFLSFLSSPGSAPTENVSGVPAAGFTENLNNGSIAPETAFGYDLGVDKRIHGSASFSIDVYRETLFDMYLPSTFLITNSYVPPGSATGYPLYGSITQNLGHARYEGVEFAVQNAPATGWGFLVQGSFQRAYPYALPPGFYCTNVPASQCTPLHYSTNLGIVPGVNFQASGIGWNTVNGVSVPYSMGYAEVNYRTPFGAYYNFGATYYGSNNTYSVPAFYVFSGAMRLPIRRGTSVQLSIDNLFDANGKPWTSDFGGIPAPLQPQCVGKLGTPFQGLQGTVCTALVPAKDRVVIPQVGPTLAGNYGPTTFRLQVIQAFGAP